MSTSAAEASTAAPARPKKLQHANKPPLKLQVSAAKRQSRASRVDGINSSSQRSSRQPSQRGPATPARFVQRPLSSAPEPPSPQSVRLRLQNGGAQPRPKAKKPLGIDRLMPPAYAERDLRPDPRRSEHVCRVRVCVVATAASNLGGRRSHLTVRSIRQAGGSHKHVRT